MSGSDDSRPEPRAGWQQRIYAVAAGLLLLFITGAVMLDAYVNHVTFYPVAGRDLDPGAWPRPVEDRWIETEDGVKLHAYWFPSDGSERALLYFHGNAGNASHRLPVASRMADLGINLLLLDYRGYGLSDGSPDEKGIYRDGAAALAHLNELGFPDQRIVLFGRSLGGAVAVQLAVDRPLERVVLCSTFSNAADMAREIGMGLLAPLVRGRFDSTSRIERLDSPLLMMHGSEDRIVPARLGRRLYDAASEPKRWVELPDVGHNDVAGSERYWETLAEVIRDPG